MLLLRAQVVFCGVIECAWAGASGSSRRVSWVAQRAELARVHARPAPALVTVLRELIAAQGDALEDHFLAPEMIYGTRTSAESAGFRVCAGTETKPRVTPRGEVPAWLASADSAEKSEGNAANTRPPDAKVLQFSDEC